jgi:hypothetical protein
MKLGEDLEDSSKVNLRERSQKRMRSHKSDMSSRKRLRIDIPIEPVDTTPALQKVSFALTSESTWGLWWYGHDYLSGVCDAIRSLCRWYQISRFSYERRSYVYHHQSCMYRHICGVNDRFSDLQGNVWIYSVKLSVQILLLARSCIHSDNGIRSYVDSTADDCWLNR